MNPHAISAALRQRVAEAARFRCGNRLTAQRIIGPLLEIDHIIPEARGGTAEEENLWLACSMCNSRKADRQEARDPESLAMVPLFNPRTKCWAEHFEWIEGGTTIQGKIPKGCATGIILHWRMQRFVLGEDLTSPPYVPTPMPLDTFQQPLKSVVPGAGRHD